MLMFCSRFKERITFKNWEPSHCLELLLSLCATEGVELPVTLHGAIENSFESLIQRVGWANARDVKTIYTSMKSIRECRLDDESNHSNNGINGQNGGVGGGEESVNEPYIMSDVMTALQDKIKQRKLLPLPPSGASTTASAAAVEKVVSQRQSMNMSMNMSDAPPPIKMAFQESNLNYTESAKEKEKAKEAEYDDSEDEEEGKKEEEKHERKEDVDERVEEEENEVLDPDTVWSSLDEALSEKGYTIYTTRDLLRSGSLPSDLIELVAMKVSCKPEKVRPMLIAQCPVLLPRVLSVIKDIEDELELQRVIKERIARADEAERVALRLKEKKRQEEAVMQRVKMIGKCCMGFEWIKMGGGYRCAGGGHFVSNSMIKAYEN
jgi:hypothetical protein